jgi:hypothetical protein
LYATYCCDASLLLCDCIYIGPSADDVWCIVQLWDVDVVDCVNGTRECTVHTMLMLEDSLPLTYIVQLYCYVAAWHELCTFYTFGFIHSIL